MAHRIKRRIIECLLDAELSFTELLNAVGDSNHGRFGYHLRTLKEFVELEPSTKKYCLTERGKLLATCIKDIRLITSTATEFVKYVEHLVFGDHAVTFYHTEDFKHKIVFPFLKAGLLKGESVLYLVSEQKLDSEIRQLQKYFDIELDHLHKEFFSIMSAGEWYLEKGRAQAETITANWLKLLKEKRRAGLAGIRVAGETEVFFNYAKGKELLRYEELLGRQLAVNICAMCLYYDRMHRLNEEQFTKVCNCHGHIIAKGIVGRTTL